MAAIARNMSYKMFLKPHFQTLCRKAELFIQSNMSKVSKRHVSYSRQSFQTGNWRKPMLFLGIGAASALMAAKYSFVTSVQKVEAATIVDPTKKREMGSNRRNLNFIADVVEKIGPAVVYIEIQGRHPFSGKSMAMSNGSGFIVREDGRILTNAHVVGNKKTVMVRLQEGTTYQGVVEAVDAVSDLATVKINAKNLPTIELGDSSQLRPGEWVVAMGSPFQLSNTVTAGIVSTVNRGSKELGLQNKDMEYIQTDAVINFGNSGGPLVNLDGEAIGINTMKVTTGISFAIPVDYAKSFLQKVEHAEKRSERATRWFGGGKKRRYIGITMLTLTPSIMMELKARLEQGFPDIENGVLVHKVVIGSPAYNSGIRPGDVVTRINGDEIMSSTDVYKAIEAHEELHLTVRRGSDTILLTIIPEEAS